jgi:hypothetical protein
MTGGTVDDLNRRQPGPGQSAAGRSRWAPVRAALTPPGNFGPGGTLSLRAAWAGVVTLYLAGWGRGLYDAIAYWTGAERSQSGTPSWVGTGSAVLDVVCTAAGLLLAGLLLARAAGVTRAEAGLSVPRTVRRWAREVWAGSVAVLAVGASFALAAGVFGSTGYPFPPHMSARLYAFHLVHSALAGPLEELLLLVVPVWVLRRAGQSWPGVFAYYLVSRLAFHAYYGWGFLALGLWASVVFLLYVQLRCIWGLLVAHSVFDVVGATEAFWPKHGLVAIELLVAVLSLEVSSLGWAWSRRRRLAGGQGR